MEKVYRIFVINNGSTSQKLAYFENEKKINQKTVNYSPTDLAQFKSPNDQLEMRKKDAEDFLKEIGVKKHNLNLLVTRSVGEGLTKAGGYYINDRVVAEAWNFPIPHVSRIGPKIVQMWMKELNIPGYIYDSENVDEFNEYAKLSGLKEFPVRPGSHTLNQKMVARMAAEKLGGKYEDYILIVAHLGGGVSIALHDHGKLVDSSADAYSPERAGSIPMMAMIDFTEACFSGKYTLKRMIKMQMGGGGMMSYLGTSDIPEIEKRIKNNDKEAELYYRGMVYQLAKNIGAMATITCGKVDRIVLTGGMSYSKMLCDQITECVRFIAPVEIIPGSYEMEALALGALRIARGEETVNIF